MIKYKVKILDELKKAGYTTYRIRQEQLLAESTLQKLRDGEPIHIATLDKICSLLNKQPSELIEFIKDGNNDN